MKKTWVKRENMYYKPFYKQKSKMLLLGIFLLGIIFFIYQALSINQLPGVSTPFSIDSTFEFKSNKYVIITSEKYLGELQNEGADNQEIKIIRGIRLFDYGSYKPDYKQHFSCLDGSKTIPFQNLNDDYCDCPDGSDEPSTNACANGKFYCKYQKRHITGRGHDIFISSSRINDKVCDCCDGSDEWTTDVKCQIHCT